VIDATAKENVVYCSMMLQVYHTPTQTSMRMCDSLVMAHNMVDGDRGRSETARASINDGLFEAEKRPAKRGDGRWYIPVTELYWWLRDK